MCACAVRGAGMGVGGGSAVQSRCADGVCDVSGACAGHPQTRQLHMQDRKGREVLTLACAEQCWLVGV